MCLWVKLQMFLLCFRCLGVTMYDTSKHCHLNSYIQLLLVKDFCTSILFHQFLENLFSGYLFVYWLIRSYLPNWYFDFTFFTFMYWYIWFKTFNSFLLKVIKGTCRLIIWFNLQLNQMLGKVSAPIMHTQKNAMQFRTETNIIYMRAFFIVISIHLYFIHYFLSCRKNG